MRAWLGDSTRIDLNVQDGRYELDVVVHHEGMIFIVEVKGRDEIPLINSARHRLGVYAASRPTVVPVIAVPYMGPKARAYARSEGLSWLDLSGNADIRGPGVRILVEGQPNRFASPGRPSTAFSDKASRISRAMLVEPQRWWRQRDLVEVTELSTGFVSKVVGRLDEDELLDRAPEDRSFGPRSPDLLLDAWAQVYDFRKHDILRFHAVGRTGASVAESVAKKLAGVSGLRWVATGLAAAWLWTHFADFRLATFFVSEPLADPSSLGLRAVERGENVWIAVPRDDGVFYSDEQLSGIRCAHPVQVYLDLLGHPERAEEAASYLRAHKLDTGTP